ncbi:hypothetical protein DUNSADRAFT_1207 [Dunaliella salina]|uniref:Encoded protein n=1 Tax=Dunaliella salina TaxID=3046 RepID=A0ABQ7GXC6_DUNSA|nr:hypothetical protein DUNSADRAFT_1207 [Dunaliella salina]|eukprot:KAF5839263.1 hypothetical protein DUNSADRAFT_1207 [Dunaliella salina]
MPSKHPIGKGHGSQDAPAITASSSSRQGAAPAEEAQQKAQTAADRAGTAADRSGTAADRAGTAADRAGTAADRAGTAAQETHPRSTETAAATAGAASKAAAGAQSCGQMDIVITMTPAQHWSARGAFDRLKTLWGGYLVRAVPRDGSGSPLSFWFAGTWCKWCSACSQCNGSMHAMQWQHVCGAMAVCMLCNGIMQAVQQVEVLATRLGFCTLEVISLLVVGFLQS